MDLSLSEQSQLEGAIDSNNEGVVCFLFEPIEAHAEATHHAGDVLRTDDLGH
jgi:hypothetical protein